MVLGNQIEQSRFDDPSRLLGETVNGFFVGRTFVPKAWLTDKYRKEHLHRAQIWNVYISRAGPFIPMLLLFAYLAISRHESCSSPASASKLVPEGFGVEWGPLVSALVISIVTTFDALYLHPKQMCQRAPAMKLWDGTFRFAFLYGFPIIGPFLQSKGRVRLDILKAHRMRLPQPHQRSMFQVSKETDATEDQAFSILRAKIVEKFTEEEHSLFETPDGRFFTKTAKGVLMEITLDVRLPTKGFFIDGLPVTTEDGEPTVRALDKKKVNKRRSKWRSRGRRQFRQSQMNSMTLRQFAIDESPPRGNSAHAIGEGQELPNKQSAFKSMRSFMGGAPVESPSVEEHGSTVYGSMTLEQIMDEGLPESAQRTHTKRAAPAPKMSKGKSKAAPSPQRPRAQSISSAAAAAAATVKRMDEDEVLEMSGADLITSRLEQWGLAEDGEEEDTIVVDEDKVHEELPAFLASLLPVWDGSKTHQNSIVVFEHNPVSGHRCEAYLQTKLYSNWYLRWMFFTYLLGMTVAAVAFAATATWCHGEIFTTIALFSISSTVWAVKAPCVVPVWSPGFVPKRIAQVIFNTLFTMDLWSDLTVALDLAFGRNTKLGIVSALFFFCITSPVDFANLCMRIGYSLEDLPDRSHLLNIIFEIPMLAFNMFLVLGPVPSAGKIGGWISVVLTFTTLVNASLMFFFKPEVLKYRAVVGHMVVKVGQKMGKAVTRGFGSELLSSPDSRATKDHEIASKKRGSGKRRTTGWQAENSSRTKRERSEYDSDEDFGSLAQRNFFPPTSSTGFSSDGHAIQFDSCGLLPAASDAKDSDGIMQRRGSATAHMSGGERAVFENSLYLDSPRSSEAL